MSKLLYNEGDIFDTVQKLESKTILPHVCNNQGAWGAGFVIPLGKVYPQSRMSYLKWKDEEPESFALGHAQFVEVSESVTVANMISQTLGGSRPLRYDALVYCMLRVASHAEAQEIDRIDCPLFGGGLAGGNWAFIHKLIQDCWITRGIGVTVHYMPDKSPAGFMEWFSSVYIGEVEGGVEVQP